MELSIANHGKKEPITDLKKDKVFTLKVDKTGKKPANEAFAFDITAHQDLLLCQSRSPPNKQNERR